MSRYIVSRSRLILHRFHGQFSFEINFQDLHHYEIFHRGVVDQCPRFQNPVAANPIRLKYPCVSPVIIETYDDLLTFFH